METAAPAVPTAALSLLKSKLPVRKQGTSNGAPLQVPSSGPNSGSKPLVRTKSLPSGFVPATSGLHLPRRLPSLNVEPQPTQESSPQEHSATRRVLKFGTSPSASENASSPTMWPLMDDLATEGAMLAAAAPLRRARPPSSVGRRSGLSNAISASSLNRQPFLDKLDLSAEENPPPLSQQPWSGGSGGGLKHSASAGRVRPLAIAEDGMHGSDSPADPYGEAVSAAAPVPSLPSIGRSRFAVASGGAEAVMSPAELPSAEAGPLAAGAPPPPPYQANYHESPAVDVADASSSLSAAARASSAAGRRARRTSHWPAAATGDASGEDAAHASAVSSGLDEQAEGAGAARPTAHPHQPTMQPPPPQQHACSMDRAPDAPSQAVGAGESPLVALRRQMRASDASRAASASAEHGRGEAPVEGGGSRRRAARTSADDDEPIAPAPPPARTPVARTPAVTPPPPVSAAPLAPTPATLRSPPPMSQQLRSVDAAASAAPPPPPTEAEAGPAAQPVAPPVAPSVSTAPSGTDGRSQRPTRARSAAPTSPAFRPPVSAAERAARASAASAAWQEVGQEVGQEVEKSAAAPPSEPPQPVPPSITSPPPSAGRAPPPPSLELAARPEPYARPEPTAEPAAKPVGGLATALSPPPNDADATPKVASLAVASSATPPDPATSATSAAPSSRLAAPPVAMTAASAAAAAAARKRAGAPVVEVATGPRRVMTTAERAAAAAARRAAAGGDQRRKPPPTDSGPPASYRRRPASGKPQPSPEQPSPGQPSPAATHVPERPFPTPDSLPSPRQMPTTTSPTQRPQLMLSLPRRLRRHLSSISSTASATRSLDGPERQAPHARGLRRPRQRNSCLSVRT